MSEFWVGKATKPIITKRCIICGESITLDSPESVCLHCKETIDWLKRNQYNLARLIAQEKHMK